MPLFLRAGPTINEYSFGESYRHVDKLITHLFSSRKLVEHALHKGHSQNMSWTGALDGHKISIDHSSILVKSYQLGPNGRICVLNVLEHAVLDTPFLHTTSVISCEFSTLLMSQNYYWIT